jgi:hypothetical protein
MLIESAGIRLTTISRISDIKCPLFSTVKTNPKCNNKNAISSDITLTPNSLRVKNAAMLSSILFVRYVLHLDTHANEIYSLLKKIPQTTNKSFKI